jgi:hypothetical protein
MSGRDRKVAKVTKMRWPWPAAWLAIWILGACGGSANQPTDGALPDSPVIVDAAIDAAPQLDAALDAPVIVIDATPLDAAPDAPVVVIDAAPDAPQLDARLPDAPVPPDAPQLDARLPDAPVPPDAPQLDARLPDAPIPPDARPLDARLPDAPAPDAAVPVPQTHLRLVAGNISSGNGQAYEGPGIRIFAGLHPDVAMIQEFNFNAGSIRSFVDQAFGPEYAFVRGASGQQIPNGVISRYPILDSGEWIDTQVANRAFVWARIDVPGPIDLFAISVHLLTANAGTRNVEAGLLVQNIQGLPANAYVVLGGDFNTDSRTEAPIQTLSSVLVTGGPPPVDLNNSDKTNANRNKPYDWVLASPSLDALESDTVIGAHHFPSGFVADTRVYAPIADLAPALQDDSGAAMMQHMAVVRDFTLPGSAAPAVHVDAPNGGETWQAGTSQTISWSSTAVSTVRVELLTGAMTLTLSASTPAVDGHLTFTVPALATTDARARVTALDAAVSDSSDAPFSITIGPPPAAKVFLNEILSNEPGTDPVGEFVELVNSGGVAVDLSGWTIADAVQVRHVFAAGTVLGAGRAIVVFGDTAGIPSGLSNAVAASSHTLSLSNSGDTVTLASPTGTVDSFTYAAGQPDGVSLNRSPDGSATGGFVLHNTLVTAPRSPGVRATGAAF